MPGKPVLTLTVRQAEALRVFAEFVACHRYPPSVQEMADRLDVTRSSAEQLCEALVRKGYLMRHPGRSRGMKLSEKGRAEGKVKP